METENLIKALAADATAPVTPHLWRRLFLGVMASGLLMAIFWGPRSGWSEAILAPEVALKQLLPLGLSGVLLWSLTKPLEARRRPLAGAVLLLSLCAGLWGIALYEGGNLWGRTWWQCLLSIPALALPIGGVLFAGLRHRIEYDSTRSGFVAGLLAGALAASVYAIHCDDDGPAFYLLWYTAAILACGLAGRLAGRRLLYP
ncbi:DUF1109 domain-containing protein [Thioclava sp. GXIMD4216]|uniref:DUF1109 domain-containing protein n=1 Tax=unclassified Thioclava TaxID=2621713 RepID=UPI0030D3A4E3